MSNSNLIREYKDDSNRHIFECEACQEKSIGIENLLNHLKTSSHQERISKQELACCDICKLRFTRNYDFFLHLDSEQHINRVRQNESCSKKDIETKSVLDETKATRLDDSSTFSKESSKDKSKSSLVNGSNNHPETNSSPIHRSKSEFIFGTNKTNESTDDRCSCCYVTYTSLIHKEDHLKGQEHKKKFLLMQKFNSNDASLSKYFCGVCYLEMNSQGQFEDHLKSPSHHETTQKYQNSKSPSCKSMPKSETMTSLVKKELDEPPILYKLKELDLTTKFQTCNWLDKRLDDLVKKNDKSKIHHRDVNESAERQIKEREGTNKENVQEIIANIKMIFDSMNQQQAVQIDIG